MAVTSAGIEQGVAAEQGRLLGMGEQADMAHGMARRIQRLQFHRLADLDDIAGGQGPVYPHDSIPGVLMRQQLRARGGYHGRIAADVVVVLMGVQHLGDFPTPVLGVVQAHVVSQRVDGQRLAAIRTGNEIIEVTPVVTGPDLFDDHCSSLL